MIFGRLYWRGGTSVLRRESFFKRRKAKSEFVQTMPEPEFQITGAETVTDRTGGPRKDLEMMRQTGPRFFYAFDEVRPMGETG